MTTKTKKFQYNDLWDLDEEEHGITMDPETRAYHIGYEEGWGVSSEALALANQTIENYKELVRARQRVEGDAFIDEFNEAQEIKASSQPVRAKDRSTAARVEDVV